MTRLVTQQQRTQRVLAWSFSRYKAYDQCPAFFKYKHLEHRPEPQSPAAEYGDTAHKALDNFVSGNSKLLQIDVHQSLKTEIVTLRKLEAQCEQEWAFNQNWQKTDWFAKDAWLRMKVDTHFLTEERGKRGVRETTVNIIDYKTGKLREDHELQRSLYAIGGFIVYPDAAVLLVQHWYLDSGDVQENRYSPKQFEKLKRDWLLRVRAMQNDTQFNPRPGPYCKWCPFRKANGGPCRY